MERLSFIDLKGLKVFTVSRLVLRIFGNIYGQCAQCLCRMFRLSIDETEFAACSSSVGRIFSCSESGLLEIAVIVNQTHFVSALIIPNITKPVE